MHLPLHIFEERYRALVNDAMARDRHIGMIQPRNEHNPPDLFEVGCLGRIIDVEAMEDGRFNLVLEGVARFRVLEELDVPTAFRQVQAQIEENTESDEVLSSTERAALDSLGRLDDNALVNGIAQVAPFDVASKQALLEVDGLAERSELIIQMLHFFGPTDRDSGQGTLQ